MTSLTAVLVPVEGPPTRLEIPKEGFLEAAYAAIGNGCRIIETLDMASDDITVYVDEEGLFRETVERNERIIAWWADVHDVGNLRDVMVAGGAIVLGGVDEWGDQLGLPEEIADAYLAKFGA